MWSSGSQKTALSVFLFVLEISHLATFAGGTYTFNGPPHSEGLPMTCSVHWRYRRPCGGLFISAAACQSRNCCFQFVFYGPMCFQKEIDQIALRLNQPPTQSTSTTSTTQTTTPTTTTTTTTTTKPTTTTRLTTTIKVQPSARSQRTLLPRLPADYLEILELFALLESGDVGKAKSPPSHAPKPPTQTLPLRRHPVTAVQVQSSSVVFVEEAPVSRGVGSPATDRETCDYAADVRRECGFPGITPPGCRKKGCCWDHGVQNKTWCFHKSSALMASPLPEEDPLTREDTLPSELNGENESDPARRNTDNSFQEEELLVPSLPQDPLSVTETDVLSVNESSFLAMVEQEISGLGSSAGWDLSDTENITTLVPEALETLGSSTTTTTTTTPEVTEPWWLQQLVLEAATAPTESSTTATTTKQTTTTTPTTTTTTTTTPETTTDSDVLPPFPDNLQSSHSQSGIDQGRLLLMGVPPDPVPTPKQPVAVGPGQSAIRDLAVLLKLIGDLQKKQRQQVASRCELDERDSCCRADPYAPCCEFTVRRGLTHRAAPLPRIVGGGPAGQLRYSVAYLARGVFQDQFCGGTLIDNQWVLTAAHCVLEYCNNPRSPRELIITLGKYRKSALYRDIGQQEIGVSHVICHHNHCKSPEQPRLNDLALIRLQKPAVTTMYVSPASLPSLFESPDASRKCIMLGWGDTQGTGYSSVLKQASVPLISNEQCNLPDWRNCVIKACMMCAGAINNDPCKGDSGGPLFCQRSNGLYVLHGVYSWGRCGSEAKKPAVYMRTSYFVDWITNVMTTIQ